MPVSEVSGDEQSDYSSEVDVSDNELVELLEESELSNGMFS